MMSDMSSPASRVIAGSPAVDPEVIEQLRFLEDEDQPNVVAELLTLYIEHAPPKLQAIHEALERADFAALKRAAHSLKGSSANVGARGMHQVCERLEHDASPDRLAEARSLYAQLVDEYAVVEQALKAQM
jgi:HPt (histidine-containing phosphotransfer) domain-containing protein